MTDSLHQEPERDQFKTESPIRAFTSWTVQGRYALGKGFRPSLAHVIPYLNAMEAKEGWQIVQVLEADTQTPSFLFRQSYVVPDDVLIERLRGDDGFKQQVRDWLNGEEPYVRNREGFEEAGWKMDRARAMSDSMTMERTEIDGHLAFKIGIDPEKRHHTLARWTAKIDMLKKAMFGMKRDVLKTFLDKEMVLDRDMYWETASVASVLRLIDRLEYWDHITLADCITEAELGKVLGRKFHRNDPALMACTTDIYKAMADMLYQDQPLGETYVPAAESFSDDVDPASRDPLPPAEAIGGHWTDRGSDIDIPVERHEDALRFIAAERGMDADRLVKDFMLYFKERNQRNQVTHKTFYRQLQFILPAAKALELKQLIDKFRVANQQPPIEAIVEDDPINPKHYGGTACAEIGELLSANSYQVLKYNWRLGEKDSPCVEIGKSLWYLDRELALISEGNTFIPGDDRLPDRAFFDARLEGRSPHTTGVANMLVAWNRYGNPETLKLLRRQLESTLESFNGCNDWGSGLAI